MMKIASRQLKWSVLFVAAALSLVHVFPFPSLAAGSEFDVTFSANDHQKIAIFDANGRPLGHLPKGLPVNLIVDSDTIEDSTVNGELDIRVLFSHLPMTQLGSRRVFSMSFPNGVQTQEGTVIAKDETVFIDLNDFMTLGVSPDGTLKTPPAAGVADNDEDDDDEDDGEPDGISTPVDVGVGNQHGRPFPTKFLSTPTCSCKYGSCSITSHFGRRRAKRTTNGRMMSKIHGGIDVAGGAGTPIIAAADGCVTPKSYNRSSSGLTIFLAHGNGWVTSYSHLQRAAPGVHSGVCFKRGQTIGYMGSSGNTTGPDVHFQLFKNGFKVDPEPHLISKTVGALSAKCSELPDHSSVDYAMESALGRATASRTSSARFTAASSKSRHSSSRR